jgi:hypothetical protein
MNGAANRQGRHTDRHERGGAAVYINAAGAWIIAGTALAAWGSAAAEYRAAGAPIDMVVGQSSLDAAGAFRFNGDWGHMLMSPASETSIQLIALVCAGQRTDTGLSGTCAMTDRDGDIIHSRWHCEMTAPPGRIALACDGRAVVTDGSGKFGSATGDNAMLLFLPAAQKDAATAYAVWPAFGLTLVEAPETVQQAITDP